VHRKSFDPPSLKLRRASKLRMSGLVKTPSIPLYERGKGLYIEIIAQEF
jgi:hypothetical protein